MAAFSLLSFAHSATFVQISGRIMVSSISLSLVSSSSMRASTFLVHSLVFADGPVLLSAAARKACYQKPALFLSQPERQPEHIFPSALLFLQIIVVISDIIYNCLIGQIQDPGSCLVDEVTVVGNIEYCSCVTVQCLFKNLF